MDNWQIIIPVLTTILGYYFGKWNRETDRRIKFRDEKVKEAQTYIYSCIEMHRILYQYELLLLTNNKLDEETKNDFETVLGGWIPTKTGAVSALSIGDSELSIANREFLKLLDAEYAIAIDLVDIYNRADKMGKEVMLRRALRNSATLTAYISIMQRRLNKLAQEVP